MVTENIFKNQQYIFKQKKKKQVFVTINLFFASLVLSFFDHMPTMDIGQWTPWQRVSRFEWNMGTGHSIFQQRQ